MQVVGLTGSIAMGKSYAAGMFQRFGLPVFDSDAAVHALFQPAGGLPSKIAAVFGDVLDEQGAVDRQKLGAKVLVDDAALRRLEGLVHPAVAQSQSDFLASCARQRFDRVVLDIPLLFEGGRRTRFDAVIAVICSASLQRQRALARPGMTDNKLESIRKKQTPASIKARLADIVIHSGHDRGETFRQVSSTLDRLESFPRRAWPRHWR